MMRCEDVDDAARLWWSVEGSRYVQGVAEVVRPCPVSGNEGTVKRLDALDQRREQFLLDSPPVEHDVFIRAQ